MRQAARVVVAPLAAVVLVDLRALRPEPMQPHTEQEAAVAVVVRLRARLLVVAQVHT